MADGVCSGSQSCYGFANCTPGRVHLACGMSLQGMGVILGGRWCASDEERWLWLCQLHGKEIPLGLRARFARDAGDFGCSMVCVASEGWLWLCQLHSKEIPLGLRSEFAREGDTSTTSAPVST